MCLKICLNNNSIILLYKFGLFNSKSIPKGLKNLKKTCITLVLIFYFILLLKMSYIYFIFHMKLKKQTKQVESFVVMCIGRALLLLPYYSIHSFSFSNIKQNLDYLIFHFGKHPQINFISKMCFNIVPMEKRFGRKTTSLKMQ